jgi:hypothetical protein
MDVEVGVSGAECGQQPVAGTPGAPVGGEERRVVEAREIHDEGPFEGAPFDADRDAEQRQAEP